MKSIRKFFSLTLVVAFLLAWGQGAYAVVPAPKPKDPKLSKSSLAAHVKAKARAALQAKKTSPAKEKPSTTALDVHKPASFSSLNATNKNSSLSASFQNKRPLSFGLGDTKAPSGRYAILPDQLEPMMFRLIDSKRQALSITDYTPQQAARVTQAINFFAQVPLADFYDIRTWTSPQFRQHAAVLRSPKATQYAYYIQGADLDAAQHKLLNEVEGALEADSGYIPTMIGEPHRGTTVENIYQTLRQAPQTDQPILVHLNSHGGVDRATGKFHTQIGVIVNGRDYKSLYMDTQDIATLLQFIRRQTKTPELNFATTACEAGQFLNEFAALPEELREGINVFVESSARQSTLIDEATLWARSLGPGENIKMHQMINLFKQLARGNLFVQAYVDGQVFNPIDIFRQHPNLSQLDKEIAGHLWWLQNDLAMDDEALYPLRNSQVEDVKNDVDAGWISLIMNIAKQQANQLFGEDFRQAFDNAHITITTPQKKP